MTWAKLKVPDAELMTASYVPFTELAAGRAVQLVSSEYPQGYRDTASDSVKGYRLRPETWPENADTACQCQGTVGIDAPCSDMTCFLRKSRCTVDGVPVAELALLIKPVAFLVTVEHGTHELTRVFFHGEKFQVGVDTQRLGGIGIGNVDYRTQGGLRITWDHGYEMFIPSGHCQVTWRLPSS